MKSSQQSLVYSKEGKNEKEKKKHLPHNSKPLEAYFTPHNTKNFSNTLIEAFIQFFNPSNNFFFE